MFYSKIYRYITKMWEINKSVLKITCLCLFICLLYIYSSYAMISQSEIINKSREIYRNYIERLEANQQSTPNKKFQFIDDLSPLYIITPTFPRPEQIPELVRLSHTLLLVPNLYWLVIEDAKEKNPLVTQLLERTGLNFEHLLAPMPDEYKMKVFLPKGVANRNRGLRWLRANATTGVFYFADDDNTYDLQIFEEMRNTKRVSMWPVGLVTERGISTPIVRNGKFDGFYDGWIGSRKFPVDMAGFAVSVHFLLERPNATMPYEPGYEEDGFLRSLSPFEPEEIELLASNCTKIFTWHTQTKRNSPARLTNLEKFNNTNLEILQHILVLS